MLPQSLALASILASPFLHASGRVNHVGAPADMLAVRASLEQFKGGWLAPIHSLEGLLLIRAPVAPEVAWL